VDITDHRTTPGSDRLRRGVKMSEGGRKNSAGMKTEEGRMIAARRRKGGVRWR
jgi:hypothetical protein